MKSTDSELRLLLALQLYSWESGVNSSLDLAALSLSFLAYEIVIIIIVLAT